MQSPLKLCEKLVIYNGESKILSKLDMNLSYLLDLTQAVFSVCHLSDIIRTDEISKEKYLSILSEHIGYLTEELENKIEWLANVHEYYNEKTNKQALEISTKANKLLTEMLSYYTSVQKNFQ